MYHNTKCLPTPLPRWALPGTMLRYVPTTVLLFFLSVLSTSCVTRVPNEFHGPKSPTKSVRYNVDDDLPESHRHGKEMGHNAFPKSKHYFTATDCFWLLNPKDDNQTQCPPCSENMKHVETCLSFSIEEYYSFRRHAIASS